jgi:DNA-binding NarL/FixJ family response regulator
VDEAAHYRLVIAGCHPLFRGALLEAVAGLLGHFDVEEARSFDQIMRPFNDGVEVDLILLDFAMPSVGGFAGFMYLHTQYPNVPIVVVSAVVDPTVICRCMAFGASGFIPETLGIDMMRAAIVRVLEGRLWTPPDINLAGGSDAETSALILRLRSLTAEQVRILMMLSEGFLNRQIAHELRMSEATVKAHVSAILQNLGVHSRTQAVAVAAKIGVG